MISNIQSRKSGMLEVLLVGIVALGFWIVEGNLAPAPTFSDCIGTISVLQ